MRFSLPALCQKAKTTPQQVEDILVRLVEKWFDLSVENLTINPSAVSLNSVNGRLELKGKQKLFFKFHAEEGERFTVNEYYNSEVLEKAGFPVIKPLYQKSLPGEQFLIYPLVEAPTMYDVCGKLDQQFLEKGAYDACLKEKVLRSERALCEQCFDVAKETLGVVSVKKQQCQALWQLFTNRFYSASAGVPRLDQFYRKKTVLLPGGISLKFEELLGKKWIINGRAFQQTLGEVLESCREILRPTASTYWPVITAHGDDHNGNKFFFENSSPSFAYFDPAFASNFVPALLAYVKTTFHDCFAHPFWFYEPERMNRQLEIEWSLRGNVMEVNHNWMLEQVAPFRQELLARKGEFLWEPLLALLRKRDLLPRSSFRFLKDAFFCCAFLTQNLLKLPTPELVLLGLSRAIEMGSEEKRNKIDAFLTTIIP